MVHSSALLRNSAADATVSASVDKRSSGVAMRQKRGVQFGEVSEGSLLGQVLSFVQPIGAASARRSSRRNVVEATATFESKTKVALVRIGTRGRLVPSGLLLALWICAIFFV